MDTKLKTKLLISSAALCSSMLFSGHSVAGLATAWGTSANSNTFGCITAGCGGGGVIPPGTFGIPEDNSFDASASSFVSDTEGAAEGHGDLVAASASANTIKLTGQATSSATGSNGKGGASNGESTALDGYLYTGTSSTTITVTLSLSGTFSGPTSGDDSNLDGIFGNLYLFSDSFDVDDITATVDSEGSADLRFCLGECWLPADQLGVGISDLGSTLTDSFDITLSPGDSFYLFGTFGIGAAGGGSAVSMSSLDVSFSDLSGIESASVGFSSAVPVPAAVWLFGSGLIGLIGVAKRRA